MNPILIHLANLKFYAKFKKSDAKSFDQFLNYIEEGSPENFNWEGNDKKPLLELFEYIDPIEYAEFEGDIEDFLERKKSQENIPKYNTSDWYEYATSKIESIISKDIGYVVLQTNPFEILKTFLIEDEKVFRERHMELRNFIGISTDIFFEYTSWMQGRSPEDFFLIFSEEEKEIKNFPLIKCFPRIFVDCKAYAFFTELQKEELNQADQNFLYVQLKNDGLIHSTAKEFEDHLNDRLLKNVQIYGHIKGENPKFRRTYDHYHSLWY